MRRLGAAAGTVNVTVGGESGVRSRPDLVAKVGDIVIVPAVVPDCNRIWLAPLEKTAVVVLAGMVNATVFPPVENCTEGSGEKVVAFTVAPPKPIFGALPVANPPG